VSRSLDRYKVEGGGGESSTKNNLLCEPGVFPSREEGGQRVLVCELRLATALPQPADRFELNQLTSKIGIGIRCWALLLHEF
jgi:hypothetical protein